MGLRWWNEVNTTSGDSHWVFESSDPNIRTINATDKRFFWLSLYATPALWIGLAILAIVRLQSPIWLSLVGMYPVTSFFYLVSGLWIGGPDADVLLSFYSYCADFDDHQYGRVLEVRSLQSRFVLCQSRTSFGWDCEQPGVGPIREIFSIGETVRNC